MMHNKEGSATTIGGVNMKHITEYSLELKERTIHIMSTDWFLKNAMRIRFWLYKNEAIVLTNRGAPYAYIRPISEDEEAEILASDTNKDYVVVTPTTIAEERRKFQQRLVGGKKYLLGYYKGIIGAITADIPEEILEGLATAEGNK
jgi:hypothetical protein